MAFKCSIFLVKCQWHLAGSIGVNLGASCSILRIFWKRVDELWHLTWFRFGAIFLGSFRMGVKRVRVSEPFLMKKTEGGGWKMEGRI